MTLRRYDAYLSLPKRATVYFEPEIHRALRLKAAATDRSISDMVNEAVKLALAEDAEDLAAFEDRAHERSVGFEAVVK
ncbi:MAG: CopG family transcriptional regulator [Candidatus Fraserbacteria bacterium RBG_16_55_9]|uniref:CopG family transcriptional regulator n=1 Tax=Fraserbacteria sp. (strain RBG_16_55_9) TaxID=1817864 RepID=A0A1F5V0J9_FRAXR|nr:MAG: CopG family transcriptional regulator [Candidatus Fraserbacteria bacterium RBG_16_55_9]